MVSDNSNPTTGQQTQPIRLKDIRKFRVLLLQPESSEGQELHQHLNRIGCCVQMMWPPPPVIPQGIDVVLVFLRPIVEGHIALHWDADCPPAVLIAIVDYENPLVVEKALRLRAQAVIGLPLRTLGILANVLLSVNNHRREQRLRRHTERMSAKLKSIRDIDRAKAILMEMNNISEKEAYETIRSQAMNKRTTIEAMATAIIHAGDLFREEAL